MSCEPSNQIYYVFPQTHPTSFELKLKSFAENKIGSSKLLMFNNVNNFETWHKKYWKVGQINQYEMKHLNGIVYSLDIHHFLQHVCTHSYNKAQAKCMLVCTNALNC